jgi:hypothetical protein
MRQKGGHGHDEANGDGKADFEIKVNPATLVQGDFIL